jgi:thioesterase domain-containing protein
MTTFEFLSHLRTLDIEVRADGDRLRCNAPSAVLTAELQQEISTRKAQILEFLRAAKTWTEPASSLIPLQPAGHQPPFFGVPGHNGDVFCYVPLVRHLGPEQPFYGLQPPGTDGKRVPLTTVEELAGHFITDIRAFQPVGPYFISGFCMGGITAFEIAQQLQRAGHKVALLALFGSPCPTAMALPHRARMAAQRSTQRIIGPVKTLWQLPLTEKKHYLLDRVKQRRLEEQKRAAGLLHNPHRAQVEQATVKAVHSYTAQPYSGPITFYFPNPQSMNDEEDRFSEWQLLTTDRFTSEVGPPDCTGDTMLREPYAKIFAEWLRIHIDQVKV